MLLFYFGNPFKIALQRAGILNLIFSENTRYINWHTTENTHPIFQQSEV